MDLIKSTGATLEDNNELFDARLVHFRPFHQPNFVWAVSAHGTCATFDQDI